MVSHIQLHVSQTPLLEPAGGHRASAIGSIGKRINDSSMLLDRQRDGRGLLNRT